MKSRAATLDASAVSLSLMCLIHCLALPVMSAFLPLAGAIAEIEWIHKALVLIAIPVTGLALTYHRKTQKRLLFVVSALVGLSLLLVAAFVERLEDHETLLTTIGATVLAFAHTWRWLNRHGDYST